MIPVLLTAIKTQDGIALEGIVVRPERHSKKALIWLHGLTSRFSSGQPLIRELSGLLTKNGIGYFKFNTRGHNIASRGPKGLIGSGFERFEDCVEDIRALIRFARELGYRKIILAGHSTGANKTLYYAAKTRDRTVKGIILVSPGSDRAGELRRIGSNALARRLTIAHRIARKNPRAIMPPSVGFFGTARRYLSLYAAGNTEDVFPYHNPRARWTMLKRIRIPVAVVIGSRDEHLDRPAKNLIEAFRANARSTKSFEGIIIRDARHGFRKREKELARTIVRWVRRIS